MCNSECNEETPLILIVNDDGVFSPGLAALCDAVCHLGKLLIAAPCSQQTSMGRSYPREPELGTVESVKIAGSNGKRDAYSIVASPSFCAAYGVLELARRKPDLCISGINYGENLGQTLTYSGTLGAALQASAFGVPSIAVSRPALLSEISGETYASLDWHLAATTAAYWAEKILSEGMPFGAPVLNINVPEKTVSHLEYRYTAQSNYDIFQFTSPDKRCLSAPYTLPTKKTFSLEEIEKNSDIYTVLVDELISVTPVEANLTLKSFMK